MALYTNGRHSVSSFPSSPPKLHYDGRPYGTSYNNYSEQFSEHLSSIHENSYDDYRLNPSRSGLGIKSASGQIDTLSSRFLSAVSDNVKIPPAVTATASSLSRRTSLSARAKSLATYVPSLTGSITDETSPKRPMRRFGSLLSGSAPPSPSKEEDLEQSEYIMEYKPSLTATPERTARAPLRVRPVRTDSSASSRGLSSWFGAKKEVPSTPQVSMELEDPFLNLNVTTELFPTGFVDPLAPSSFNDLLLNAESLIKRLQTGYKEKVDLLRTSRAEREAQNEEVEEAETRARHLKIQLDEMAAKAAERDHSMQVLADELAAERLARQELLAMRNSPRSHPRPRADSDRSSFIDGPGEEDMTPRRPGKVAHRMSEGVASDSGFESDAETASTFSGPTTPISPGRVTLSLNVDEQRWESRDMMPKNLDLDLMKLPMPKVCGGNDGQQSPFRQSEAGAWSLVSSLRQENSKLQTRVKDLEGAVEGCLSIVGGL